VVLGMQLFALGLLGELIIFTHARDIKDYQIDAVIRYPHETTMEGSVAATVAVTAEQGSDAAHTHAI
jgi:hypothetical protein